MPATSGSQAMRHFFREIQVEQTWVDGQCAFDQKSA
jgi:hypothetical protein